MMLLVLFVEAVTLLVLLDLWLVNNKKMHLFTPLMQLIPDKQRKVYQVMYYDSLKRMMFCVLDKIPVSYFYFYTLIGYVLIASFLVNVITK